MTWEHPSQSFSPGLRELYSFCTKSPIPFPGIVVLLVCQEGPNVDVSFRPLLICCLRKVNNSDEPVAVSPDVKYHISVDVIGIPKHEPNFSKIVPSDAFDYNDPCLDLIRSIWILLHGLAQMLARHNVHWTNGTSQYVK